MTLKDRNRPALFLIIVCNLAIFYALSTEAQPDISAWWKASLSIQNALPFALAIALVGIVNTQLSATTKERIVFWKWENPLPGSRAFSFYAHQDPRIDISKLEQNYGPLPLDPIEQNRKWYRIYKQFREDPSVIDANKGYLFARDYAGLSAMMLAIFGATSLYSIESSKLCITYILCLSFQLFLATNSARTNAIRLVTTSMAIASSKHGENNE